MKTFLSTISISVLMSFFCFYSVGQVEWINTTGGQFNDDARGVAIDGDGNIVVVGRYQDSVDFDYGLNEMILTTETQYYPYGFVQKLDAFGNLIWVKSIGSGSAGVIMEAIEIDDNNKINIVGHFGGDTCDFDPGLGVLEFISNGLDAFVLQLDQNGSLNWVHTIGGSGTDRMLDLTLDNFGNLYVCGHFEDSVDFDTGASVDLRVSQGLRDCFFQKYDNSGNLIWTNTFGGNGYDHLDDIVIDATNNLFICGIITDSIDMDPSAGINNISLNSPGSDFYVSKFDNSGSYFWTKVFDGFGQSTASSITTDPNGQIYILGTFQGNLDVNPGPIADTVESMGNGNNIIVIKLNSSGDYLQHYIVGDENAPLSLFAFPEEILFGSNEDLWITGSFQGDIDFDPSPSTFMLSSEYIVQNPFDELSKDVFIAKLNSDLEFLWAAETNSIGYNDEFGLAIEKTTTGKLVLAGSYTSECDFALGGSSLIEYTSGASDIFILQLGDAVGIDEIASEMSFTIYPNPTNGIFQVEGVEGVKLVTDTHGQIMMISNDSQIDLGACANGVYFVRTENGTKKVVLQK